MRVHWQGCAGEGGEGEDKGAPARVGGHRRGRALTRVGGKGGHQRGGAPARGSAGKREHWRGLRGHRQGCAGKGGGGASEGAPARVRR